MNKEVARAIGNLSKQMNELGQRIDNLVRMLDEKKESDIDYIAMETGVELDQSENGMEV